MKRLSIVVAMVVALCFSALVFTGCGNSSMVNGKYVSIEAYLEQPSVQSQLESMTTGDSSLKMEVKAEDNKLVYEYTYTEVYEDSEVELLKSSLETASESAASTFSGVASSLKEYVNVENPVVVTRYFNGDNTLIYEAEYPAE